MRTLEKDLPKFDMQGKAASAAPLKMLFVTALPENLNERSKLLEIEEEQKRLIDAIGSFEATGGEPKIVIEFLDTASLAEISEALRKHQHDIVHISGHGSYQKQVKQGVLHLEDEDGNHREVLGGELGETLRQHQCVKLLILSACETAMAGNGVVEQLAEFGLPSIVAMRFSVTDDGAKVFTTALYAALSKGETLTHALAAARESLWQYLLEQRRLDPHRPHLAEWFTPVVYLNQYTEALVNPKEKYVLPEDFTPAAIFSKPKIPA
ncbi:MAG: CHAT domain-containing protein [Haliscomenobacter sp.]|nr:CHAT domain-containing protein [Haliscomenobacter sp.]MBK9488265.1 CHAT domain-containing protein [Haliscomenobacter sp.]